MAVTARGRSHAPNVNRKKWSDGHLDALMAARLRCTRPISRVVSPVVSPPVCAGPDKGGCLVMFGIGEIGRRPTRVAGPSKTESVSCMKRNPESWRQPGASFSAVNDHGLSAFMSIREIWRFVDFFVEQNSPRATPVSIATPSKPQV